MSSSKPISISLGSKKPAAGKAAPSLANRAKPSSQPNAGRKVLKLSGDADSDDDSGPQPETVVGFDSTGAVTTATPSTKKGPLVIKTENANSWRNRLKAQREQRQKQPAVKAEDLNEIDAPSTKAGLSFAAKAEETETRTEEDREGEDGDIRMKGANDIDQEENHQTRLSEDEIAVRALAGADNAHGNKNLVIQTRTNEDEDEDARNQQDEIRNFRNDIASRPEPASLADYDAVPVEDFGAALLRGMGWKDGQTLESKYGPTPGSGKPPTERRPALLGIGAKGLATKEEDRELRLGIKRQKRVEEKKIEHGKDGGEVSERRGSRERNRDRENRHRDRHNDRDRHSDRDSYRRSERDRDQNRDKRDKYRDRSEGRARENDRDRRYRERSGERHRHSARGDEKYSHRERDLDSNGHRHRHRHGRSTDKDRDR